MIVEFGTLDAGCLSATYPDKSQGSNNCFQTVGLQIEVAPKGWDNIRDANRGQTVMFMPPDCQISVDDRLLSDRFGHVILWLARQGRHPIVEFVKLRSSGTRYLPSLLSPPVATVSDICFTRRRIGKQDICEIQLGVYDHVHALIPREWWLQPGMCTGITTGITADNCSHPLGFCCINTGYIQTFGIFGDPDRAKLERVLEGPNPEVGATAVCNRFILTRIGDSMTQEIEWTTDGAGWPTGHWMGLDTTLVVLPGNLGVRIGWNSSLRELTRWKRTN